MLGALADGYNGEGSGLAHAAIDDALTFFPLGAVAGARAAVKFGTKAAKVAKGKGFWSGPGAKKATDVFES